MCDITFIVQLGMWIYVSFLFGLFYSLCLWEFDSEWVCNKDTDSITCLLKVFILDKRKISINNSKICGPDLAMTMACLCVACQLRMVYIVLKSCKNQNKECTIEIRCGLQRLKYLLSVSLQKRLLNPDLERYYLGE